MRFSIFSKPAHKKRTSQVGLASLLSGDTGPGFTRRCIDQLVEQGFSQEDAEHFIDYMRSRAERGLNE